MFKLTASDTGWSVQQLSKSIFHGYSRKALFFYRGRVCTYGLNGLHTYSREVVFFDDYLREWQFYPVEGFPEDILHCANSWFYNDTIHALYNLDYDSLYFEYGIISINALRYQTICRFKRTVPMEEIVQSKPVLDRGIRYNILLANPDKTDGKYEIWDLMTSEVYRADTIPANTPIDGNYWVYTEDELIYAQVGENSTSSFPITTTGPALHNYKTRYLQLGQMEENANKRRIFLRWMLRGLLILLLSFVLIKLIRMRKSSTNNQKLAADQRELDKLLEKYLHRDLSKEELDDLFNISNMPPDSAKVIRSKKIAAINERGIIEIKRIRHASDRRIFVYRIEPNESETPQVSNNE